MEFRLPALSVEDIAALENKYNEELLSGRSVDKQTIFNYAFALVQSEYRQDLSKGVELFQDLLKSEPDHRDYMYYKALGLYRSKAYADARAAIDRLLQAEPGNRQALALREAINEAVLKGAYSATRELYRLLGHLWNVFTADWHDIDLWRDSFVGANTDGLAGAGLAVGAGALLLGAAAILAIALRKK